MNTTDTTSYTSFLARIWLLIFHYDWKSWVTGFSDFLPWYESGAISYIQPVATQTEASAEYTIWGLSESSETPEQQVFSVPALFLPQDNELFAKIQPWKAFHGSPGLWNCYSTGVPHQGQIPSYFIYFPGNVVQHWISIPWSEFHKRSS